MFPPDSKILIVDDSSFARTVLKGGLKDLKFWKIIEADNAKVAQRVLEEDEQIQDPVSLLIADIHMPEMSGLELLKWVRSHERLKNLPVIILTSSQEKGEILVAGKLGVSHFMIKPFDVNTLRDRLGSAWERHGQKYLEEIKK
ncbi:MAG: response regulator [Calothrix sp. SM1_5_4]|nr:response regulator [Calothrix sp. SM1_5_4]